MIIILENTNDYLMDIKEIAGNILKDTIDKQIEPIIDKSIERSTEDNNQDKRIGKKGFYSIIALSAIVFIFISTITTLFFIDNVSKEIISLADTSIMSISFVFSTLVGSQGFIDFITAKKK